MTYKVFVRRNSDGKTREVEVGYDINEEDLLTWWEDGNGSCDCNREIYFDRANGDDKHLDSYKCSDGQFSINIVTENGFLLKEFK